MIKWDESSGIRERLYLLAELGVNTICAMNPEDSPKYYDMTDHWRLPISDWQDDGNGGMSRRIKVIQTRRDVDQSLHVIAGDGKISVASIMNLIGFPLTMVVTQIGERC